MKNFEMKWTCLRGKMTLGGREKEVGAGGSESLAGDGCACPGGGGGGSDGGGDGSVRSGT